MFRIRYYFIASIALLLFTSKANAQFRIYSNEFLNIGAGARGLSMGGAQIASVQGATASYWNPAALANVEDHPEIALMDANYFSGIGKYWFGSMAIPTNKKNRTLGISFIRFGVDDIPNTLYLVNPDGSIDYNNISSFSSADYAFLFSYAEKLSLKKIDLNVGGNAKIIYRQVGAFAQAWGFGFDLGAQMKKGNWHFGAVIKDVTTTFNAWTFSFSDKEKEILYLTNNQIPVKSQELTAPHLTIGAGYEFSISHKISLLAETNWAMNFDGKRNNIISSSILSIDPNFGLEADYNKVIYLRAGVGNFQQALSDGDTTNQKKIWLFQPSIGLGVNIGNFGFDYALSNLANQSNPLYSNMFSLRIKFIETHKKIKTPQVPSGNTGRRKRRF